MHTLNMLKSNILAKCTFLEVKVLSPYCICIYMRALFELRLNINYKFNCLTQLYAIVSGSKTKESYQK